MRFVAAPRTQCRDRRLDGNARPQRERKLSTDMDALCPSFGRPLLGVIEQVSAAPGALNTRADCNQTNRRDEIAIYIAIDAYSNHRFTVGGRHHDP